MTVIWVVYLQLALRQYRRSSQPVLLIHHAHQDELDALCLFVNMSGEPVHVSSIVVNVYGVNSDDCERRYISEYQRINPNENSGQLGLRQGPVQPGGYLVLGSFADILLNESAGSKNGRDSSRMQSVASRVSSIEICIAVIHGSKDFHVGARRRFFIENDGVRNIIRAYNIYTEHLLTRRKSKIVREWVESDLKPMHVGSSESDETEQDWEEEQHDRDREAQSTA